MQLGDHEAAEVAQGAGETEQVAGRLAGEQEQAAGEADVYPRLGRTMEWDIAAGQAILEALGGTVVHAETGESLRYNKANLTNPYFVARTAAMLSSDK